MDLNARNAAYLWWAEGPGVTIGIGYEVRVAAVGHQRSRLLEARGYGESEDSWDGSPRAPVLVNDSVLWPHSSNFSGCTTTLVRQDLRSNATSTATSPDSVFGFASDGQRISASLASGPALHLFIQCGDASFSCRLADLPRPSFAPSVLRPYAIAQCWRYRPDGARYCIPDRP